jgi:hypothetical protein
MHLSNAPTYHAEITNHDGQILVVLFGPERLFSRGFRKICDAERWLTTLARRGLSQRATFYLNDEGRAVAPMPPFGPITVKDARVRKQTRIPECFA